MSQTPHSAMIFAAGFGTRMGALTRDRPKPLLEVGGQPLLDHALDLAAPHVAHCVVNAHYHAEQIAAHLAARPQTRVLTEKPDILDTGGGLKNALPHLGSNPVLTLNSDAVFRGADPVAQLITEWESVDADAFLLLVPPERAVSHAGSGDFVISANGRLSRGPGLIYTGVQILRTEGLAEIADRVFSLNLLWDRMLANGRVSGLCYDGQWCDVGTPAGLAEAAALLGPGND